MSVLIPNETVAIGIGAVCGAISRYQVGRVCGEWIATDPNRLNHMSGWHTALINIGGSFLLGGVSVAPSPSSKMTPDGRKPMDLWTFSESTASYGGWLLWILYHFFDILGGYC